MLYIKKIEKACSTGNFEEKDKNGKQVLSKQQNEFVYELIIQKYQQSIFKKKVGAIGDTIIEKREKFAEISLEEQCKVLMQIFLNFQSGIGVELKIIEDTTTVLQLILYCQQINFSAEYTCNRLIYQF